ncbi:MAG: TIGR00730 family Rossman fold protein [Clostridia bacterium]|jgi:uncharacterized protein (TIGR00730 family)|nr:TIGR00730 family Rossman fold protein [Clostridia bacterium]MCI1959268.1 TIGR00730 family Rossman fold protein [Clostridia bacterium]MCI2000661.1 TIGR00730 family Rossman fold protein [Clostridia bacterium]MCI2015266.1 TIGR00730 family Rossman fold protein [Clostridia bacterium]
MNICIYGAASNNINKEYIAATEDLGRTIAQRGHALIFGGGNNGLMGAAARGAFEKNGKIIGISPKYFNYDGEIFGNCTKIIFTDNLKERKRLLEDNADAFIILPGGIGTMDEFFETLAQKAAGEHKKPMALFNISGYFNKIQDFILFSKKEGFIRRNDDKLYGIYDKADEILKYIESEK